MFFSNRLPSLFARRPEMTRPLPAKIGFIEAGTGHGTLKATIQKRIGMRQKKIWLHQRAPRRQSWTRSALQGGKTFCAIFCASFIAGSRRAFLCVDCTVCLFVTERVLTKTEWNAQGVNVCYSKSRFTFVWFLFFVTWKLLWTRNNQCERKNGSFRQSEVE